MRYDIGGVELKTIYILLTYSGTVLSRVINVYTREPYSHVSVSLDRNLNELYSFGRLNPKNPLFAGFVREDIENGTYARFPNTKCALYALEITDDQFYDLLIQIENFKMNSKKYRYNFLGLIGAMFNFPIEREKSYFCSQFVSSVLNNSGVRLIDKPNGLTEPKDFRVCEDLNLIYEGNLKAYYYEDTLIC